MSSEIIMPLNNYSQTENADIVGLLIGCSTVKLFWFSFLGIYTYIIMVRYQNEYFCSYWEFCFCAE